MQNDGRKRVVISQVEPEIDGGKFPIKRIRDEQVEVYANIFSDGHEQINAQLKYRHIDSDDWNTTPLASLANDRWTASFHVAELGEYEYTVEAWIDHFLTWQQDIKKKLDDGQDVSVDLQIGADIMEEAIVRATGQNARELDALSTKLRNGDKQQVLVELATSPAVTELMHQYPDKRLASTYDKILKVTVDREKALFSSWYEMFPRSAGEGTEHGSFKDAQKLLPDIAEMGFDIIYLPPIHPIGRTHRKGKNNSTTAKEGDPGSPWAIGSEDGGHKAIHPKLGTMDDFEEFVRKAREFDIDIALDIAFQCSPDHPYVKKHPKWFKWRPDGSVQFAKKKKKKYEDILPINFESSDWENLWEELYSVIEFWVKHGVKVFRIDNPHTKPFGFWETTLGKLKSNYPELIFLSEAFTRPKMMYHLAKIGYTQSYTYFTWRNTKHEFIDYLTELYQTSVREFFRPNFWPNTPDILPESLQYGGRPAFIIRVVLAATLSSSYGIYGPAYELCENEALEGKEEYLNSEKYEIKDWDREQEGNIRDVITHLNKIRKEHPALQQNWNLQFYDIDNEHILCYGKVTDDLSDMIFVAINLDPYHTREGKVVLPLGDLNIPEDQAYLVHELFSDEKFIWQGNDNFIELNPKNSPAKIFNIRRRLRRENDFDYFM